jgi:hypothetical protein
MGESDPLDGWGAPLDFLPPPEFQQLRLVIWLAFSASWVYVGWIVGGSHRREQSSRQQTPRRFDVLDTH